MPRVAQYNSAETCAIQARKPSSNHKNSRKALFSTTKTQIQPDEFSRNTPSTLFLHAGLPGYRNRPCHCHGSAPPKLPDIPQMLMLLCQRGPRDTGTEVRTHTGHGETHRGSRQIQAETSMVRTAKSPRLLAPGIQRIQVAKRGGRLAPPARPGRNQDKEKTHKE